MLVNIINGLESDDNYLVKMIESVDKMIFIDPCSVILKARAISERMVNNIIEYESISGTDGMNQKERIILLQKMKVFSEDIAKMFQTLRFFGNRAIHGQLEATFETSLMVYRLLFRVLTWYIVNYVKYNFESGNYVEPDVIGRIEGNK